MLRQVRGRQAAQSEHEGDNAWQLRETDSTFCPSPYGALAIVLVLAVAYTAHDTLQMHEPFFSVVSFAPGMISLWVLLSSGFTREECGLAARWFSRPGIVVLVLTFLLLLPILLPGTPVVRWDLLSAVVYAPASGVAQELFFRSALLPVLTKCLGRRSRLALPIHCVVIVAYHLRTFRSIGAFGPSIAVAVVLFLAGLAWGWESQRDRTVLWTSVQHSIFLGAMSLHTWG